MTDKAEEKADEKSISRTFDEIRKINVHKILTLIERT